MVLTSHRVISDIFNLENVAQMTGMMHAKSLIIDQLRDVFAQDRQFSYKQDVFGFPLTPSSLGLDPDAGLDDNECTRIFIGSSYRYDVKFNPSIIVRSTGSRYDPISFNQNWTTVTNRKELLVDGYGNQTEIITPAYYNLVGALAQTFEVKVIAESEADREEIADIVQVALIGTRRLELQEAGVFIKTLSTSGETETQYANDVLYMVSINLETRTEWRVRIPISDTCERIGLCLTFRTINGDASENLSINQVFSTADLL